MCGHAGLAGNIAFNEEKIIKTLLILDSLRGEHSTGLAAVGKWNEEVRVAKQVGGPFDLFETAKFGEIMGKSSRVLLGHNRYATSGAVSRTNAHPFDFDTLVGAHNGTLSNKYKLADADRFKVDSENLFHHIEQYGLDDAINIAEGAWALVWWNKVEKTLNFLRNKERTLFYCWNEKQDVVFWASEGWMLDIALWRHGVKRTEIQAFDVDTHYSLEIKDKGEIGKPVLRKCASPERGLVRQDHKQVSHTPSNTGSVAGGTVAKVITLKGKKAKKAELRKQQQEAEAKRIGVETTLDGGYLSKKGVRLELMANCMDMHGSWYLSCFDPIQKGKVIRLYYRRGSSLPKFIGEEIVGDISAGHFEGGKPVYKVDPWSAKLALTVDDANAKIDDVKDCTGVCEIKTVDVDVDGVVTSVFPTHKSGEFVNETEWYKRYDTCAYCNTGVFAEEANAFTSGGDCICPSCIDHAKDIVSLIQPSASLH